jgi:hypothetical protein
MIVSLTKSYLKAAENVFNSVTHFDISDKWWHNAGCYALDEVIPEMSKYLNATSMFADYFRPDTGISYWFGSLASDSKGACTRKKNHRVFALLLMSELTRKVNS